MFKVIYLYKLLLHINLYKQMPSDICNKEITINGKKEKQNLLESQEPLIYIR